jgi:hypothetical protein
MHMPYQDGYKDENMSRPSLERLSSYLPNQLEMHSALTGNMRNDYNGVLATETEKDD